MFGAAGQGVVLMFFVVVARLSIICSMVAALLASLLACRPPYHTATNKQTWQNIVMSGHDVISNSRLLSSVVDDGVDSPLSMAQKVTYVYISCLTSPFSILGSAAILFMILRRKSGGRNRRLGLPQHRILSGMCVMDIIYSASGLLNPFLIPAESGIAGTFGNQATCTAMGVLTQFAINGTGGYNALLSIYFFLVICFKVRDRTFLRRVEVYSHAAIVASIVVLGSIAASRQLYNLNDVFCYLAAYPAGCESDEDVDCVRGEGASSYMVYFLYGWLAFYLATHFVCHIGIFWTILRQTRKMETHAVRDIGSRSGASTLNITTSKKVRQVAVQSTLYMLAFLATWIGPVVFFLSSTPSFGATLFGQAVFPLQGLFNFFVYIRLPFLRVRQENPELSFLRNVILAVQEESNLSSDGNNRRQSGCRSRARGRSFTTNEAASSSLNAEPASTLFLAVPDVGYRDDPIEEDGSEDNINSSSVSGRDQGPIHTYINSSSNVFEDEPEEGHLQSSKSTACCELTNAVCRTEGANKEGHGQHESL